MWRESPARKPPCLPLGRDEGDNADGGDDEGGTNIDDSIAALGGSEDEEPVTLTFTAVPRRADVFRDDTKVCDNTPCDLELPRAQAVTLEFRAPGFETEKLSLTPSESRSVSVRLKRNAPVASTNNNAPNKMKRGKRRGSKKGGSNPFDKVKAH